MRYELKEIVVDLLTSVSIDTAGDSMLVAWTSSIPDKHNERACCNNMQEVREVLSEIVEAEINFWEGLENEIQDDHRVDCEVEEYLDQIYSEDRPVHMI